MNNPSTQITFRHMTVSPAAEARIHEEIAALQRICSRITSCHVVVEAPHQHHQRGPGFAIKINLHVPGAEIVVNHEPALHGGSALSEAGGGTKQLETQADHKDVYVSIRDAFAAARRQLEDHTRVLRGDVKHHAHSAEAL